MSAHPGNDAFAEFIRRKMAASGAGKLPVGGTQSSETQFGRDMSAKRLARSAGYQP